MFKILIDTCVWLDLAKDYQRQTILAALEELIRQGDVELIMPRTIVIEFGRNKARVVEESSRSLSSNLKRVKEAVEKLGDPRRKGAVLRQLNDMDHRSEHASALLLTDARPAPVVAVFRNVRMSPFCA